MGHFTLANNTLYIINDDELSALGFLSELPSDLKHLISFLNKKLTKESAKSLSLLFKVISLIGKESLDKEYQEVLSFYSTN